jgi:hemolysin III
MRLVARSADETKVPSLPLLDAAAPLPDDETKPLWRGWIHTGTLPVAIAAGIVLVVFADGFSAKWSSAVFALTSILLFGISSLYHRFTWKPRARVLLKRFDHANIFLLIAGTYTPLAVMALPFDKGSLLLILVWSGALLGIGFRMFWIHAPRWLYVPLYIALGWVAMIYILDFYTYNAIAMTLILSGGLCYTLGAVIYGMKKPNPFPGHFGFHEIFHTLTVMAFICHWIAVLMVSLNPLSTSLGG